MHTRLYALLSAPVLALGLSLASPAHAASEACGALSLASGAECSRAGTPSAVEVAAGAAGISCSVSPRLRLLRAAGTTSIITTTFAVLGALFILRRRRF